MSACPAGFFQKFVTCNGVDFPYHPAIEAQYSPHPVGFHVCYGCSGQHNFADCPIKRDPGIIRNTIEIFLVINRRIISKKELVSSLIEKNRHGRFFIWTLCASIECHAIKYERTSLSSTGNDTTFWTKKVSTNPIHTPPS